MRTVDAAQPPWSMSDVSGQASDSVRVSEQTSLSELLVPGMGGVGSELLTNDAHGFDRLRARFEAASEQDVTNAVLAEVANVLRAVAASHGPSLHLRAQAQGAARQLERLRDGLLDELREVALAQLAPSRYVAAIERDDTEADEARRYLIGPEGLRHAVSASRGTLCGLPADAVEVLRSVFVADRIDSCPTCSALAQG